MRERFMRMLAELGDLQRYVAFERPIIGFVDLTHSSRAEAGDDLVMREPRTCREIGHN